MFNVRLFDQDADRPYCYTVKKGLLLVTEEVIKGPVRWTRFVRGRYHRDLGFMDTSGYQRIPISIIVYDYEKNAYCQFHDKDWIESEFNRIIQPKTLTALHYYPGVSIASIITGLPLDTEDTFPEQLRTTIPRETYWQPIHTEPLFDVRRLSNPSGLLI